MMHRLTFLITGEDKILLDHRKDKKGQYMLVRWRLIARFAVAIVALGALSASISPAQQAQQAKSLHFEVASIKPGNPQPGYDSWSETGGSGGYYRMMNMPLKQWVKRAFSVRDYALKAPAWLDTARFDLNAKFPANAPKAPNTPAEMMKSLLIERFGLKWHEETQSVTGYELVPDKKVLIKPSGLLERLQSHGSSSGPGMLDGTNMPISELAGALGEILGRPVVDATHLSGVYNFKLAWRPSDDAAAANERRAGIDVDNLPSSVSSALREQLGLRLQSAKVPTKVIVVDYMNHQPIGN